MYIAIDDSYSTPENQTKYFTSDRRTHVAVIFEDNQVDYIREQMRNCLEECSQNIGKKLEEFHFNDIYNRRGIWKNVENEFNLNVFEFFAEIYKLYEWPIEIQSIDKHTLVEHGIGLNGNIDGLNLEKKEDQSLLFLVNKIKANPKYNTNLTILVDEGVSKNGNNFGYNIFKNWKFKYEGKYVSSKDEPLIQIADFFAYSINRCTHLQLKTNLTDYDLWFLQLISSMNINCKDLGYRNITEKSNVLDIDKWHEKSGRKNKGLKNL